MSSPTLYGKLTDVYTSSTLPSSLVPGQEFVDWQAGKRYKLYTANGAIAIGAVFKRDPAAATKVIATAAAIDFYEGVNTSGAVLAANDIFWGQIYGDTTALVAASQNAGVILAPSGTAGTLTVGSAAAVQLLRAQVLVDSGAGGLTSVRLL